MAIAAARARWVSPSCAAISTFMPPADWSKVTVSCPNSRCATAMAADFVRSTWRAAIRCSTTRSTLANWSPAIGRGAAATGRTDAALSSESAAMPCAAGFAVSVWAIARSLPLSASALSSAGLPPSSEEGLSPPSERMAPGAPSAARSPTCAAAVSTFAVTVVAASADAAASAAAPGSVIAAMPFCTAEPAAARRPSCGACAAEIRTSSPPPCAGLAATFVPAGVCSADGVPGALPDAAREPVSGTTPVSSVTASCGTPSGVPEASSGTTGNPAASTGNSLPPGKSCACRSGNAPSPSAFAGMKDASWSSISENPSRACEPSVLRAFRPSSAPLAAGLSGDFGRAKERFMTGPLLVHGPTIKKHAK